MPQQSYFYLLVSEGTQQGAHFPLDPAETLRIGRDTECDVVLADPLCSRVHAEMWWDSQGWWIRDRDSRNGTYVDDRRIGRVLLSVGSRIRMGGTELILQASSEPLTSPWDTGLAGTHSLEKVEPPDPGRWDSARVAGDAAHGADWHQLLHRLCLRLLGAARCEQVVRWTLELIDHHTSADWCGFYRLHDDGTLAIRASIPETLPRGHDLAEWAGQAVASSQCRWTARSAHRPAVPAGRDQIALPLIFQARPLGVIVLVIEDQEFSEAEFHFARSASVLMASGLVRTRQWVALRADRQRLLQDAATFDELIGDSPAMRQLKEDVQRVAAARHAVLIEGPPGTGKELAARAIHRASSRSDRPMMSVNCAAWTDELLDRQLFGYVEPESERVYPGWFQQADTGTLLLDEVGWLTGSAQRQLVEILDGRPFHPLGSTRPVQGDVWVLAATSEDLGVKVQQGVFREDLYRRLSGTRLYVPPLRERGRDVELLIEFFLEHFRKAHGRIDLTLAADARARLLEYPWPGNLRQLRNVLDTAVVIAPQNTIRCEDLLLGGADPAPAAPETLRVQDWERWLIARALQRTGGKVPEAAELLGMGRATLYRKMDDYRIPSA